ITDPKTSPQGMRARALYAVSIGLLAALLNAPARTEFWSKVAVLGALAIVCAARPVFERATLFRLEPRRLAAAVALLVVGYTAGPGDRRRDAGRDAAAGRVQGRAADTRAAGSCGPVSGDGRAAAGSGPLARRPHPERPAGRTRGRATGERRAAACSCRRLRRR